MKKTSFLTGLLLFSLFFGAGNLIFPPLLGLEAGDAFPAAIIGFIGTGVFLPLLAIFAVARTPGGLRAMGGKVHPFYGALFAIIVYMAIGPFYVIPRAANVAYDLGLKQMLGFHDSFIFLVFTLVFFLCTCMISLNPSKMFDVISKWLTPALLLVLTILFIQAFRQFTYAPAAISQKYIERPLLVGFWEGYFTMDAIAALAFGIVVVTSLQQHGLTKTEDVLRGTFQATLVAAAGLIAVYLSLGWIGRVVPLNASVENGAELLVLAAQLLFGYPGNLLFGAIVLLACLTTAVGLITACSQFFQSMWPSISYKHYVMILSIIGCGFTNFGLEKILESAKPLLSFLYPIAIPLIVLTVLQAKKRTIQCAITTATLFGFYEAGSVLAIISPSLESLVATLPLASDGMSWVVPVLFTAIIGWIWDKKEANTN